MTAWRRRSGLWRALALASWRMNPGASSLQRPPASTPKTTRRQRPGWTNSGHIRSLDLRASRSAVPAYSPLCCRGAVWLVRGNDGGVDGQLVSSPKRKTICYDFDTSVFDALDGGNVEV